MSLRSFLQRVRSSLFKKNISPDGGSVANKDEAV